MTEAAKKYKPEMTPKAEMDVELFNRLKFLLLELRNISPFFGILATEMWIAGPSKTVPTIGVSESGVVVYNEDFMNSLTPGERVAVFVHEALHVSLDYWKRFRGRNWKLANKAHDFAINDIIVKSMSDLKVVRKGGKEVYDLAVRLPEGGLWDAKYDKMSAEEIYNILFEGVAKRAKEIKDQYLNMMNDPAAKEAYEREQKINKELRISLQKAGKMITEKEEVAISRAKVASDVVRKDNDEFDAILRDRETISLIDNPQALEDQPEQPQQNAEGDEAPQDGKDPADGQSPSQDPGQQKDSSDPGADQSNDASEPGAGDQPQDAANQEGDQLNPYDQAKQDLRESMRDALKDYLGDEKGRIENDVDGTPDGTTREQQLDELSKELDKIADDYVDDVTKAREAGHEEPKKPQDSQDAEQGKGDKPGDDNEGEKGQDGDKEPGEGAPKPGEDGKDPGEGENGPGDQPGAEGQQPDADGQSGEGGKPKPGDGGAESPNGKPDGQGQGNQPGQGQGQGQGAPGQGQGGKGQDPVSEKAAREDVTKAMEDILEELNNSLSGQPDGVPGVDKQMASGQEVVDADGFEQAMRELMEELGTSMDGDVDMDASDIPGNPYKNETKEQMEERRRQMMQRAITEDVQNGGKFYGTMPGWMKSEIDEILYPPADFAQELTKFVGPYGAMNKRSFSVRNKRNTFLPDHIIRPGMKKNSAIIYIIMDVSGSMMNGRDADNLRHAMGLVEQLALGLQLEVKVIQNDTGITSILNTREAMEQVAAKKFEVYGQGGSDLTPAFEYIWKEMMIENGNRGNPIIVFTDGAIVVPESVPDGLRQACMWVTLPGQSAPTDKWGEHVIMQDL
jgi:predicted metal-dependent peptidase